MDFDGGDVAVNVAGAGVAGGAADDGKASDAQYCCLSLKHEQ